MTDESTPAVTEDDFFQEAYLDLEPRDARLYFSQAFGKVDRRSIGLSVALPSDKFIVTNDGRSLKEANWTIRLIEGDTYTESATIAKSIGYLFQSDVGKNESKGASRRCQVEATISEPVFSDLMNLLLAGRLPENVGIKVSGLQSGGFPFQRLWDTNHRQHLHVKEVYFRTPLAKSDDGGPTWPVTVRDLDRTNALIRGVQQQLGVSVKINRFTLWTTVVVAVTVLAIALVR